MKYNKLTPAEESVILRKGTEMPFSGKYYKHKESGVYACKRCNAPLYRSDDKFDSGCGWPSFDDEIPGSIKRIPDADGIRTEIVCANCGAHLGHVFAGEKLTDKNIRHCVNSISLNFTPASQEKKTEKAYFAGGCFWGVEHYFQKEKGVISTKVGSVIFYVNDAQKQISEKLIKLLEKKGYKVATKLIKADKFWKAEDYHQQYYQNTGKQPYCHFYHKRF